VLAGVMVMPAGAGAGKPTAAPCQNPPPRRYPGHLSAVAVTVAGPATALAAGEPAIGSEVLRTERGAPRPTGPPVPPPVAGLVDPVPTARWPLRAPPSLLRQRRSRSGGGVIRTCTAPSRRRRYRQDQLAKGRDFSRRFSQASLPEGAGPEPGRSRNHLKPSRPPPASSYDGKTSRQAPEPRVRGHHSQHTAPALRRPQHFIFLRACCCVRKIEPGLRAREPGANGAEGCARRPGQPRFCSCRPKTPWRDASRDGTSGYAAFCLRDHGADPAASVSRWPATVGP
jgi:hypothetical protein